MFAIIAIVLVVLWALGFLAFHVSVGLIQNLPWDLAASITRAEPSPKRLTVRVTSWLEKEMQGQ